MNLYLVLAQSKSFMDKYLPLAELFDSPYFFWPVMGSAILFLLFSFIFLFYVKRMEKQVKDWGEGKSIDEIVARLDSDDPKESRYAFVYLRNYVSDVDIERLIEILKKQRKSGKINPHLIFLLEDLNVVSAIPLLEEIARGKSHAAELAKHALDYMIPEEELESKKA